METQQQLPIAGPDIEERVIKGKELCFQLTEPEVVTIAKKASKTSQELEKDLLEFSNIRSEWKSRIEAKETALSEMLKTIGSGKELRIVECIERKNFSEFSVQYIFESRLIETRPMTADERQVEFNTGIVDGDAELHTPPEPVEIAKEEAAIDDLEKRDAQGTDREPGCSPSQPNL